MCPVHEYACPISKTKHHEYYQTRASACLKLSTITVSLLRSSKSLKRPLDDTQKPALRKMRAVSGFNVWHREYLQSNSKFAARYVESSYTLWHTETRRESLSAANKESSLQWQSLSEEEKQTYKDKAKAVQSGETRVNVKKECKKILGHLQEVVSVLEYMCMCSGPRASRPPKGGRGRALIPWLD